MSDYDVQAMESYMSREMTEDDYKEMAERKRAERKNVQVEAVVILQTLAKGAEKQEIRLVHHAGFGFIGKDIEVAKILNDELMRLYESEPESCEKWLNDTIGYSSKLNNDDKTLWSKCLTV